MTQQNPILQTSNLPFGATDFAAIQNEHFLPALNEAIRQVRAEINTIKQVTEPNFDNTIVALELAHEPFSRVQRLFHNLFLADSNESLQGLAPQFAEQASELNNDILLDRQLFLNIKAVYDRAEQLNLDQEQHKLLEETYRDFKFNGALLDDEGKAKLRSINGQLAQLAVDFSKNILAATNDFKLKIKDPTDLQGLPPNVVEAAKNLAKENKHDNEWWLSLQMPSYLPFMKFSPRRSLRETLWRAHNSRALNGENSNREIIKNIARLRCERAQILGYQSHAHYHLVDKMAETPETVFNFITTLRDQVWPATKKDLAQLSALATTDQVVEVKSDQVVALKPWDYYYYAEKLKEKVLNFNDEELRPYFPVDQVINGAFEHASRLYQIDFKQREDLPKYHPEVTIYEVTNQSDGSFIGLFYTDFFSRPSKQGGAWMTDYKSAGLQNGTVQRPHVSIVCNFAKPSADHPSLLNLDEVETIFHEFGHALHSLLTQVRYCSLSGTNVARDFVELPSQIMENWLGERDGLDIFARHYQTGEALPEDLAQKIKQSRQFLAGYFLMRQLNFCFLDMAWHSIDDPNIDIDVEKFENDATQSTAVFPPEPGTNISCSFAHIFAGGYSAGYYGYLWAEVLDADAFELFEEKGLFNQEVAKSFRQNILEKGGVEKPMKLYQNFRGHEPDTQALLRRYGFTAV